MTDILTKRNRHPLYGNKKNTRPSGNIGNSIRMRKVKARNTKSD